MSVAKWTDPYLDWAKTYLGKRGQNQNGQAAKADSLQKDTPGRKRPMKTPDSKLQLLTAMNYQLEL